MNTHHLKEWLNLTEEVRRNIFNDTAKKVGLPTVAAVEKDWWVVQALSLIFKTSIAPHTVFKGGPL